MKKKSKKKKIKIVSTSKHIKKISNKTYSEWLQHLIDNHDKDFFDTNIEHELLPLPTQFRIFLGDVFNEFGQYVRLLEMRGDLDLKTVLCKKMYDEVVEFLHIKEYDSFFKNKKWYDNFFFALTYVLASAGLENRSIRKAYGLSKGLFG